MSFWFFILWQLNNNKALQLARLPQVKQALRLLGLGRLVPSANVAGLAAGPTFCPAAPSSPVGLAVLADVLVPIVLFTQALAVIRVAVLRLSRRPCLAPRHVPPIRRRLKEELPIQLHRPRLVVVGPAAG